MQSRKYWEACTACIQSNIMAKRFGDALSEQESSKRLRNAMPKTTQYKTQWGIRIFESWKNERANDEVATESNLFELHVLVVASLKTEMLSMTAETFWSRSKFVQEVRDKDGNRYPEKTLYQLVCCIKRFYEENGRAEMNPLNKENYKFVTFEILLLVSLILTLYELSLTLLANFFDDGLDERLANVNLYEGAISQRQNSEDEGRQISLGNIIWNSSLTLL